MKKIILISTDELKTILLDCLNSCSNKQDLNKEELPDKFLNIKEAAELLHLTVSTVYCKVSKGELPVMKQGKRLYFSRNELIRLLKEGRKTR